MNKDIAIKVENLSKVYKLYNAPIDRMKEALHPRKKSYHKEFYALNDVSFEIKKGQTVGIIGKNGSGKSTLLKIITGVLTPTTGKVTVNGRISALLELGAGFNPEYTGMENIYFQGNLMGFEREEMEAKVQEILDFADIGDFIHQPVKNYSSGMFARLAFAVAINVEPEILIVDEALSVGDAQFQAKCLAKIKEMKKQGVTFLLVTHAMDTAIEFCENGLYLKRGEFQMFDATRLVSERYQADLVIEESVGVVVINENESRKGLKINIESVNIKNVHGVDCQLFNINEDIIIKIKIQVNAKVVIPCFGVNIKLLNDFSLWSTTSDFQNTKLESLDPGQYEITWHLDAKLNIGTYIIAIGVGELINGEYKRIERLHYAGELSIANLTSVKYGSGALLVNAEVTCKRSG